MRVLVLSAAFPSPAEPGRAPFLRDLCSALAARLRTERNRTPVTVLAPRVHVRDPRRSRVCGLEVRRFEYGARGRRLKQFGSRPGSGLLLRYGAAALGALRGALAERRFDAVYAHWLLPAGFLAALGCAVRRRLALVVHLHGSDVNAYAAKRRFWRLLGQVGLSRADKVFAVSLPLRAWARRHGAPACEHLPMGIDSGRFIPASDAERVRARAAWGIEPGRFALLFPGGTSSAKGYDLVIGALARAGTPLELIVAGAPEPIGALGGRSGARVRFVGSLPHRHMAQLYAAVDALVLPSRAEGSRLAVAEACACGLPLIATAVGDVPRLVAGAPEARLIPPPGDPQQTVIALEAAIEGVRKRSLKRLPRRAYGQVADTGNVAQRILEQIASALRRRRRGHA